MGDGEAKNTFVDDAQSFLQIVDLGEKYLKGDEDVG
jgi:hypothetical protein